MKYFDWKKVQREAYSTKRERKVEKNESYAKDEISLLALRHNAWLRLTQYCTEDELEKIQKLAMEYEKGVRVS